MQYITYHLIKDTTDTLVSKKAHEEQLRAAAIKKPEDPAPAPSEECAASAPVAPAVPDAEIEQDHPTVQADRKEAMIVEFRESWCKQFIDSLTFQKCLNGIRIIHIKILNRF